MGFNIHILSGRRPSQNLDVRAAVAASLCGLTSVSRYDPWYNSVEPPWYGPVCPVVWEGWRREASPYPDQSPSIQSNQITL
jgi:hypothetical protein